MMKFGIFNLSLVLFSINFISNSCNKRHLPTPQEYKYFTATTPSEYIGDKNNIQKILNKMNAENIQPFYPPQQFDKETIIIIDSIFYSPDKLRMIVFVITQNANKKLLGKENMNDVYYNANYLYASRDNLSSSIRVCDYSFFTLEHYESYNETKKGLYEYCFFHLAADSKPDDLRYNIDDKRFWDSNEFNLILSSSKLTQ